MICALQNFERLCSTTVLPVPKPPGTIADPPIAMGNRQSSTRWPVRNGMFMGSFFAKGRPCFTGDWCIILSSEPSRSRATTCSTVYSPSGATQSITPAPRGGTRIRCSMALVSWVTPRISPPATTSPGLTRGAKPHFLSRSSATAVMPRPMKSPDDWRSVSRGR